MPLTLEEYAQHLRVTPDWLKQEFQLADGMSPTGEPVIVVPYIDLHRHKIAELIISDWNTATQTATGSGPQRLAYNLRDAAATELLVVSNPAEVHLLAYHGVTAVYVPQSDEGVACLLDVVVRTASICCVLVVCIGSTSRWATAFAGYDGAGSLSVVDLLASTGAASFVQINNDVSADPEKFRHVLNGLAQDAHSPALGYTWDSEGTWILKANKDGFYAQRLANFSACIFENHTFDDGDLQSRRLAIRVRLKKQTHTIELGIEEFASGSWWLARLGSEAVVFPGFNHEWHLRSAIQLFSNHAINRTILRHLGWRQINGESVFIHAGGIVRGQKSTAHGQSASTKLSCSNSPTGGHSGLVGQFGQVFDVRVEELVKFNLPGSNQGRLLEDVNATFDLLNMLQGGVTTTMFACVWRAVLGPVDFVVHVFGPTGALKSSVVAVFQQFFGPELDNRHLPANWFSTVNSLEMVAHLAKEVMLVIDNLVPRADPSSKAKFERLVQAIGDQNSRGRLKGGGGLRPQYHPRGLVVSTGEELVGGESTLGRCLALQLSRGDVSLSLLAKCQRVALEGSFARVMVAFLEWLAPKIKWVQKELPKRSRRWSRWFHMDGSHPRTAFMLGQLMVGLAAYLKFLRETFRHPTRDLRNAFVKDLQALAADQAGLLESCRPTERFFDLVRTAIGSGMAHLKHRHRDVVDDPQSWGWEGSTREAKDDNGDVTELTSYRPRGACVGWLYDDFILLDPEAAIGAASRAAVQLEPFNMTRRAIAQALHESGLLRQHELDTRGTYTKRMIVQGKRRPVWVLLAKDLLPSLQDEQAEMEQECHRHDQALLDV